MTSPAATASPVTRKTLQVVALGAAEERVGEADRPPGADRRRGGVDDPEMGKSPQNRRVPDLDRGRVVMLAALDRDPVPAREPHVLRRADALLDAACRKAETLALGKEAGVAVQPAVHDDRGPEPDRKIPFGLGV
jgi:hypothetical protein